MCACMCVRTSVCMYVRLFISPTNEHQKRCIESGFDSLYEIDRLRNLLYKRQYHNCMLYRYMQLWK